MLFPDIMQLQTTSHCNKRCLYCPYPKTSLEQPMGEMAMPLVERLITEFVDKGGKFLIPYLLNEPLMDNRLLSILDFTRTLSDIPIEISTNCILLDETMRDSLIKYSEIQFVLHLNSFNSKDAENARRFLKLGPEHVLVSLFSDYIPQDEAESWLKYGEENGVLVKVFTPCDRAGNSDIDGLVLHPLRTLLNAVRPKSCMTLRSRNWIHILWDGVVVLCCQDWRRDVVLGSVAHNSIELVFNNDRYDEIREYVSGQNTPGSFLCRSCNFRVHHTTTSFEKPLG